MRSIATYSFLVLLAVVTKYLTGNIPLSMLLVVTSFFLIEYVPIFLVNKKHHYYKSRCTEWLVENGYSYQNVALERLYFSKGKLGIKVSNVQLLFCSDNGVNEKIWFICGHWWLGGYINKIEVYQLANGKNEYRGSVNA